MKALTKILFRTSVLLFGVLALQPAIFASVDDAQTFALQAAEPYVKQGFQVREDYWGGDLGSGECGSSCLRATNIGSGWEPKSIRQKSLFTFMIRTENWQKNLMDGRKAILRLPT